MSMNVMKLKDVQYYHALAKRWDNVCIICGRPFASLACVTREHIIPRSEGGKGGRRGRNVESKNEHNIAPSHYNCNRYRGVLSLLDSAFIIEKRLRAMGASNSEKWLGTHVPGRIVPRYATLPLNDVAWLSFHPVDVGWFLL